MRVITVQIMLAKNTDIYFNTKKLVSYLYGFSFTLSIISINILGANWGEIWADPKLLLLQLIIIFNLLILLRHIKNNYSSLFMSWKVGLTLWILFLSTGAVSTILSPSSSRSFWGHFSLGDGLFYWFFVAIFIVSNAFVLHLKPKLARYQLCGLLIGVIVLSLAIFIQVYDWRIDFTATSGLVSDISPDMLKSRIWRSVMPIGFYTNRGEAAFILALGGVLTLLGLLWKWISPFVAGVVYVLICTALFYTQCRGAILALLVTLVYLFVRFGNTSNKRKTIICYGVGLLIVGYLLFKTSAAFTSVDLVSRPLPTNLDNLEGFSSRRLQLWKLALQGIMERPLFGWGFDGFGLAFPYIADWTGQHKIYIPSGVSVSEIIAIGDFFFKYLGTDGNEHIGIVMAAKVHNLILDTTISVGIIGLVLYLSLLAFFIWCATKSAFLGIEATAIAYFVYTLTWYESGQFSHLGWWGLSVGLGCTKLFKGKK